jgi:hypothetical protein
MNNWCICWVFAHSFTARRLYKSFGIKGLIRDTLEDRRFQWPRGLRCWSAAASWLGLRVRIPLVDMDVCMLFVVR